MEVQWVKTSVAASPSTSARQSVMMLDYIGSNLRQQVQHRLECGAVGEDIRRHACKSRISTVKFRTKSDFSPHPLSARASTM